MVWAATSLAQQPKRETLAADTQRSTPAGAPFTAPQGWTLTSDENMVVLEPPEADGRVAIVDAQGADADAAVAAAWAAFRPDGKPRPLKLATPGAPRNGWEERKNYDYETSPNERLVVFALASRAGERWTVAIIESAQATFEKRGGQFALVGQSLRPQGYQRESFAGRKAHPLDAERIAVLKSFVESGMQQLGVPGVGLSFIDGGKVVYQGGLGVRELGKPEAEARQKAAAGEIKAANAKDRERLVIPADATESAKLAARYSNPALGELAVSRRGKDLAFDFGEWSSLVASRRNGDGSISFLTIDPSLGGFEFVAGGQNGKRTLVIRDAQHEYPFME